MNNHNRQFHELMGGFVNPSRQYMLGKLADYQKRIDVYRICDGSQERKQLLDLCDSYLISLHETLPDTMFPWHHKTFAAWHLFHRLDETMLLLMDREELYAQAWSMIQGIKTSPLSPSIKADWLVKLNDVSKKIESVDTKGADVHAAAHLIRSAAYVYNDQSDNLFWDLWCKRFFGLIYTLLLLLHGIIFLYKFNTGTLSLCTPTVVLLGAMGGLGSGIMSMQIESIPYGHFWVSALYHVLARPVQGAIAALMLFWMLQSQYLIAIEPPLVSERTIFACVSCVKWEQEIQHGVVYSCYSTIGQSKREPLVTLTAAPRSQGYLYMLVLLIAGFSGDKLLKIVTDRVTARLFVDAEKTKEAK